VSVLRNLPVRRGAEMFMPPAMILLALLAAYALAGLNVYAGTFQTGLRENDVRRGEAVLAKLRGLELQAKTAHDSRRKRVGQAEESYTELFVQVAALREGDLKTDLTTAVFLYEAALKTEGAAATTVSCEDELRDVYARLCTESGGANLSEFLRAKARLHAAWAAALIDYHRGARDRATVDALEEMRVERRRDLALGERAVAALKRLEQNVCAYASLGEFEERKVLARVSFEELSGEMAGALWRVDAVLRSLPRGPIFYALYRARNAYGDGLFWWEKTYRRDKKTVSASSFTEPDGLRPLGLEADAVNYTVVANWRNAARRTREAAAVIEALKTAG
jgi:hypothetical protein